MTLGDKTNKEHRPNMKTTGKTLMALCITLAVAGCTCSKTADLRTREVGRGAFVSEKGEAITAIYYANDTVRLHLFDKTEAELYSAISASGARYTNNAAEWWEHHDEATYDIQGRNIFKGKNRSPK